MKRFSWSYQDRSNIIQGIIGKFLGLFGSWFDFRPQSRQWRKFLPSQSFSLFHVFITNIPMCLLCRLVGNLLFFKTVDKPFVSPCEWSVLLTQPHGHDISADESQHMVSLKLYWNLTMSNKSVIDDRTLSVRGWGGGGVVDGTTSMGNGKIKYFNQVLKLFDIKQW